MRLFLKVRSLKHREINSPRFFIMNYFRSYSSYVGQMHKLSFPIQKMFQQVSRFTCQINWTKSVGYFYTTNPYANNMNIWYTFYCNWPSSVAFYVNWFDTESGYDILRMQVPGYSPFLGMYYLRRLLYETKTVQPFLDRYFRLQYRW